MVRPTPINKKPYKAIDVHNIPLPPVPRVPPQELQRPDRPETPSPASSLRFLTLRRHRMHKISRRLHVHKNGLRTRKATCPANATCVGFDDIGEFMYNQAMKCRHLLNEANRYRDPDLPPITDKTPPAEFVTGDPGQVRVRPVDVVVEIGPPHSGMEIENCWDQPSTSNNP